MLRKPVRIAVLVSTLWIAGCASPYFTDRGAMFGGFTGAVTGAALGDRHGNAAAGAALGGLTGAAAGAMIGHSIDHELAHSRAVIRERMGRELTGAVTVADVIAMSKAGVGEQVLATHIRANGVARPLSRDDLILLSQEGVSQTVIQTMQRPAPAPRVHPAPPGPVIVREHIHFGPRRRWRHHYW